MNAVTRDALLNNELKHFFAAYRLTLPPMPRDVFDKLARSIEASISVKPS